MGRTRSEGSGDASLLSPASGGHTPSGREGGRGDRTSLVNSPAYHTAHEADVVYLCSCDVLYMADSALMRVPKGKSIFSPAAKLTTLSYPLYLCQVLTPLTAPPCPPPTQVRPPETCWEEGALARPLSRTQVRAWRMAHSTALHNMPSVLISCWLCIL
jgi:hypothetical protein